MTVYHRLLTEHREHLNELNVYPVPDADTGANLGSTLGGVVDALPPPGLDPAMDQVCRAIRRGAMLGARGASGVITSQLLGALAGSFEDLAEISGADLAVALEAARAAAYRAVLAPVEGTILTVLREATDAAGASVASGHPELPDVLRAAREAAAGALARTPEMLEALATAGVVDAGGSGLLLLFDALLHVVAGAPLPAPPPARGRSVEVPAPDDMPRYEVVVRLDAPAETMGEFRAVWDRLGNTSTVIVEGRGDWVCHIHTARPEAAVEAARAAGEIRDVQVTDLVAQVTQLRAEHADRAAAVVAVALGDGMQRRFLEMGAAGVVAGGAGRNPSTAELVQAVDATGAPVVVLLPNDPNVVPAAEQATGMTPRRVVVVPTRSMFSGMAALRAFDSSLADGSIDAMRRASDRVVAGGVTRAVRSATTPEGRIEAGSWIARFADGAVMAVGSPFEGLRSIVDRAVDGAAPTRVELALGADADPAVADDLSRHCSGRWPGLEVSVIDGGQPLYPYLVGVERPPSTAGG